MNSLFSPRCFARDTLEFWKPISTGFINLTEQISDTEAAPITGAWVRLNRLKTGWGRRPVN